ncbi:MAG: chromosomal replication initiator protein DnaA [Planctomycetota bacterium]
MADRIGASRFRTWFGDATQFSLDSNCLNVTVRNPFVGSWITSNFMDQLLDATREVLGVDMQVDIQIAGEGGLVDTHVKTPPEKPTRPPNPKKTATRGWTTNLRGDLDSFVVGPSNQLAYSAARSILHNPREAFTPLVLHGGCGLGKTHLLQGICNGIGRSHPTLEWRYVSGEEFTNEFVYAVKAGRIDLFRARFRHVNLLVIDDIHFLANKKATQEEFLHTFNAIDTCGSAVVLSSDCHPRTIATLSEPLINRLVAGMVVEIEPPDFAMRREILSCRARILHADVRDDVLDFIARRITGNVRELEGALYKLVALASLAKEPIDLATARLAVEDYVDPSARTPESADIERITANYFAISRDAIYSRVRDRTTSLGRGVAMYLVRKHTRLSFPEIGRMMGNKNHSTVLMAVRRIEKTLEEDGVVTWRTPAGPKETPLRGVLDQIEREIQRGQREVH